MLLRDRSLDELPALRLRGPALRAAMRRITLAWCFGIVWMVCCTIGSHVQMFSRGIGFDDFEFGVMAALPFLATFGQIIATALTSRLGRRKPLFIRYGTLHRAAWLLVAVVPLLGLTPGIAPWVVLVVLGLSWFANALCTVAWTTWMGDLVPRRVRGRFFARRERLTLMVQIVVVISLGILFDRLTVRGASGAEATRQPYVVVGAAVAFAFGSVCGMIDILLFRGIRDVVPPPKAARAAKRPRADGHDEHGVLRLMHRIFIEPLGDRVFRRYVLFGATMTFSATVSSWYFWAMCLEHLEFGKLGTNVIFQVCGPIASILAAPLWGRMIDRFGRRPVLLVATTVAVLSLLPWFVLTRGMTGPAFVIDGMNWLAGGIGSLIGRPGMTWIGHGWPMGAYLWAALGCVLGGAGWTGVGLAQFGVVLSMSDGPDGSRRVAACSVLISVGGVLGGLVGGALSQWMALYADHLHPLRVGPFEWNNWHSTMAAAMVARTLAIFWLVGMPDPGARPVRDVMRYMRLNVHNAMTTWLFYPIRVLRQDASQAGEPTRKDR